MEPRHRAGLRALTYLAPGIPAGFFEAVCEYLAGVLGLPVELEVESRISGPMHAHRDPFAEDAGDRADIGFLCSPSYLYLRSLERPTVELVPAGFVFHDPRAAGRPVYFSEVVVRDDHPARRFEDLAGCTFGYNDESSLSGYFATLQHLADVGHTGSFFGEHRRTGSHGASIEATLAGTIDGAAIDSVVLAAACRERSELATRLRVLKSLGPFPIQPIVVRKDHGSGSRPGTLGTLGAGIAAALLDLHTAPDAEPVRARLARFGLAGCAPIDDAAYADERRALVALRQLPV